MKTVFLISFSWASIAGSLVNVDSLFMIFPPPHLCAANQPLDTWNCSCSKRLAMPQARRTSDKCVTHLLGRAPQTLLGLLGQNPCSHKDNKLRLCQARSVFSQAAQGSVTGGWRASSGSPLHAVWPRQSSFPLWPPSAAVKCGVGPGPLCIRTAEDQGLSLCGPSHVMTAHGLLSSPVASG